MKLVKLVLVLRSHAEIEILQDLLISWVVHQPPKKSASTQDFFESQPKVANGPVIGLLPPLEEPAIDMVARVYLSDNLVHEPGNGMAPEGGGVPSGWDVAGRHCCGTNFLEELVHDLVPLGLGVSIETDMCAL